MKKIFSTGLAWLWVSILVVIIDRCVKMWALSNLSFAEPLEIFPFFNLTLVYNTGAAFSFLGSASGWQNLLLGSVAATISLIIVIWLYRLPVREVWMNTALCLILGGAIGNGLDRILYGYVIDMFDFHIGSWHFAIFNIADSGISVGAFMMIAHWIFFPKYQPGSQ